MCTPFDRCRSAGAAGSSSRRSASTQAPAAFTTQPARTRISRPVSRHRAVTPTARSCSVGIAGDLGPVQRPRAQPRGRAQVGQHQPRVVRQVLAVGAGEAPLRAVERGLLALELRRAPVLVHVVALDRAELLVGGDRGAELQQRRARVDGQHHPAPLGQVRREPEDHLALERALAHQPHVAQRQVAQAAVDQLGGAARGAGREVLGLEQDDRQPAQRRLAREPRAGDPAADDREVEALGLERRRWRARARSQI